MASLLISHTNVCMGELIRAVDGVYSFLFLALSVYYANILALVQLFMCIAVCGFAPIPYQ